MFIVLSEPFWTPLTVLPLEPLSIKRLNVLLEPNCLALTELLFEPKIPPLTGFGAGIKIGPNNGGNIWSPFSPFPMLMVLSEPFCRSLRLLLSESSVTSTTVKLLDPNWVPIISFFLETSVILIFDSFSVPPWPAIIVLPLEPLSTKRLFSLLEPNWAILILFLSEPMRIFTAVLLLAPLWIALIVLLSEPSNPTADLVISNATLLSDPNWAILAVFLSLYSISPSIPPTSAVLFDPLWRMIRLFLSAPSSMSTSALLSIPYWRIFTKFWFDSSSIPLALGSPSTLFLEPFWMMLTLFFEPSSIENMILLSEPRCLAVILFLSAYFSISISDLFPIPFWEIDTEFLFEWFLIPA